MLVKQSKNTFVRTTEDYGYITNQLTYHDRTYDEFGADLLREINRTPQKVDDIIKRLMILYKDVEEEIVRTDFVEFITDLANHKFLLIGETNEELEKNEILFSYSLNNPKTLSSDFTQTTKQDIKENTQDFFLEQVQKKPRLSALQFELTSRCNERCIHCYIPNQKKNDGNDMPTDKVFSLLDEFAVMGGLHVTLSGGEVFLHKDIDKILKYCREKDLKISLLSNLVLMKEEQIPTLKEVNLSLIQVSLYSMNPEIHDQITKVEGSFEKTKSGIEKLIAADIPVQISCPVMKANVNGYEEVMKYANSHKIKANTDFIIMAQSDCDTSNLANRISLKETEDLIKDIIACDTDYKDITLEQKSVSETIELDYERFSKQPICSVGQDDCCITENGDVYPCAGWQGYIFGNVFENSLQDIWDNSKTINELRKITQASFPQCIKCEARDFCAMCLVRNFNESGGDMFKINDHFCKVAFLNKRLVEELIPTK